MSYEYTSQHLEACGEGMALPWKGLAQLTYMGREHACMPVWCLQLFGAWGPLRIVA